MPRDKKESYKPVLSKRECSEYAKCDLFGKYWDKLPGDTPIPLKDVLEIIDRMGR